MSDLLDDDDIIDEDDDIIIDEDDQVTTTDYGGAVQRTIRRTYAATAGVTAQSRSYTEISGGKFTFGYRNANSGTKNAVYILQPDSTTVGGITYNGVTCNASKIKVAQEQNYYGINVLAKFGNVYPATGYLQVITSIIVTQADGVEWTIERLPFQNGLCVVKNRG